MLNIRNSKKGFSLPLAIAVTCVLVLLSASLMFIASNSISNTSNDVNSRQAYLNVKSAISYARSYYYKGVKKINEIGVADPHDSNKRYEYMGMLDSDGTPSKGAKVSSSDIFSTDDNTVTYVFVEYTKGIGKNLPTLKLTAYSKYSDAFDKKKKLARLSLTINIENGDNSVGRITVMQVRNNNVLSTTDNQISLNVKKMPGMDWAICPYIWTYKDVANIYTGKKHYESYGIKPSVGDVNLNENEAANKDEPAGRWISDYDEGDTRNGPTTSSASQGDNWFRSSFYTSDEDVHYFNVIISRRGGILRTTTDNVQSPEMFHLWYLDPKDKEIYFEFKKDTMYYYTDTNWDGKMNLETSNNGHAWVDEPFILVYVKNPKTVVHVNFLNGDEESATTSLSSAPYITNVTGVSITGKSYLRTDGSNKKASSIYFDYEGCGWWAANVETGDGFTIEIDYNGSKNSVNIPAYSNREAWLLYDSGSGSYSVYSSEEAACEDTDVLSKSSYVTVHARGLKSDKEVHTLLSYKDVALITSTDRAALMDKINEANKVVASDFTDESYAKLTEALNEATDIYNDLYYISRVPVSKNSEKIKKARDGYTVDGVEYIGYKKAIENLDKAIEGLTVKTLSAENRTLLADKIKEGEELIATKSTYDLDSLVSFESGVLTTAKEHLADKTCTNSTALADVTTLTEQMEDIKTNHVLDKTALDTLLATSEVGLEDTHYPEADRNTFRVAFEHAKELRDKEKLRQEEINTEVVTLNAAWEALKATYITELDTRALDAIVSTASAYISSSPTENYTAEGFGKLQEALTEADTVKKTARKQDEIDNATEKVQTAYNNCIVIKPSSAADSLRASNQMRVYISTDVGVSLQLMNLSKGTSTTMMFSDLIYDSSNGLYYATVNTEDYEMVTFVYQYEDEGGARFSTNSRAFKFADYADGNLAVMLHGDATTFEAKEAKLTTLYFQKDRYGSVPKLLLNDATWELVVEDDVYYAARFISSGDVNVQVEDDGVVKSKFTVGIGQWVVQPGNNTPVSVPMIYPIYEFSSGSGVKAPAASYADWTPIDLSSGVMPMAYEGDDTVELEDMAFDVSVPADKCVVIIDMSYSRNRDLYMKKGIAPYFYAYKLQYNFETGETEYVDLGPSEPGIQMLRFKSTNFFYAIVDKTLAGFRINCIVGRSSDGSGKFETEKFTAVGTDGNISVVSGSSTTVHKYYTLFWNSPTRGDYSNGSYELASADSVPYLAVPKVDSGDMKAEDLAMPFVGGTKVRIVNRSYVEDYGDSKTDANGDGLNGGKKFGGYTSGNECKGRVGNSELKPYLDWCDFKIPVAQGATYTVSLKGLNNESDSTKSVSTIDIRNARGDIWVELKSANQIGGKYNDLSVYTFDPDQNAIGDTRRIYFAVPSGWNESSLTVNCSGVEGTETLTMTNRLTRIPSYFYVDVNKNKPFIEFSITDDSGTPHLYKTSLQGGNNVLFNPTFDNPDIEGGKGAWTSFISDQDRLKEAVIAAQSIYYGSTLIKKYNDEGLSASDSKDNYRIANGIRSVYTPYTTASTSGAKDDTVKTDEIMAKSDSVADAQATEVENYVDAYKKLYVAMSNARAYLKKPVSGGGVGKYPEYLHRTSTSEYTEVSRNNLSAVLVTAESLYESSSVSVASLKKMVNNINTAIASMEETTRGSIALLYYDVQDKLKSSSIVRVFYDGCPTGGVVVDDVNPENYPLIFVQPNQKSSATAAKNDCIKNVYFTINGSKEGATAAMIKDDEQYVMMDYATEPRWVPNSSVKYVDINTSVIINDKESVVYELEDIDDDGDLDPMVLYFTQDTVVQARGGDDLYSIKAGAYYFEPDEEPVADTKKLDLYSSKAKDFFTNPANYGVLSGAATSDDAGWTDSKKVKDTGTYFTHKGDINFIANSGMLSRPNADRTYAVVDGNMSFRWDSKEDLIVGRTTRFTLDVPKDPLERKDETTGEYIPSLTFVSVGKVKSTKSNPQFLFTASTTTSDKMIVRFLTDTYVEYKDEAGKNQKFVIREGIYLISKKDTSTPYIANLFDKTYWRSREFVKSLSDITVTNIDGISTQFSDGSYGD